ncbi:membrane protein chaperone oxaA [Lapidilactobacillus concavus DSM 17758]|uniref:Membrane protein insertase YidC n=2 Tax=Lapidilactobacillus TaxID=2767884 RepID=A0A0R1WDW4_9LACO|nr:membrane protein chaperone oxaA [Lapidilactobacillus concavus DSM 17758]GEL13159.1 membrane protein insertase YidC 2 [Lapidilactobacillus concavus]
MKKRSQLKKVLLVVSLLSLMLFLTACANMNAPITSKSTGFWNQYILYPFSWFILKLASFFGGSYGWAIVAFTIIVRVILLPLNHLSTKNMKKQSAIQPELQALQKKYSAKDMETQQKLREETQKLMSEAGVNPVYGCLPMLVQLPFMYALYQVIWRTTELKQGTFLWMQLGEKDPYYIMAILAGLFTFLSTYISNLSMPQVGSTGKIMQYLMPFMIIIPAINIASAISLYWVVTNAFQVVQTLLLQNPFKAKHEREEKERLEREHEQNLRRARKRVYKKK